MIYLISNRPASVLQNSGENIPLPPRESVPPAGSLEPLPVGAIAAARLDNDNGLRE